MANIYNSKIASLLGKLNKTKYNGYAMTISRSCTIVSVSEAEFRKWPEWVGEEDCHQLQFDRLGWFGMVYEYYIQNWFNGGYSKNSLEIEAKAYGQKMKAIAEYQKSMEAK